MHLSQCKVTVRIIFGQLKHIYILPYPATIPHKTISFILSLLLLSSTLHCSSPDSHPSLPISPLIYLESLFYFITLIFSRCECDDSLAAVRVLASGLWQLRDPAGAYHASWAAKGGVGRGKKKSNLANLKLHSHTTEDSSSLRTLPLFFTFPSALFSIRKTLFLNLVGPVRTTMEKKTKRFYLASFPHVISLISPTYFGYHAFLPCVASFISPAEGFVISFLVTCWMNWKELW